MAAISEDIRINHVDHMSAEIYMHSIHCHETHELLIVETGMSTVITRDEFLRVSGSYVIFYPAGCTHQQFNEMAQPYRRYCCNFGVDTLTELIPPDIRLSGFFCLPLTEEILSRILPLLARMMEREPEDSRPFRLRSLLALILCELAPLLREQNVLPMRKASAAEMLVHDISLYLDENSASPLRLDDIAAHFYISRAKLVRLFRQMLGMTVCEYLTNIRVQKSKGFLRRGLSVQETAALSGFANVGYYIRIFHRLTGITPAKYRQGTAEAK